MTDNLISRIEYQSSSRGHLIGSVCGLEVKCNFIFKFYDHFIGVNDESCGDDSDSMKKAHFGGKNFNQQDESESCQDHDNAFKSIRKNQSVAKHPYISLSSVPTLYIGGNDGHILIFWLDLCCVRFFKRQISTNTLFRRVPGQIGNTHYIFDFCISKRSEPADKHFLVLKIEGSKIGPTPAAPEHLFSTEFDEENAYFLMQILKKANQVFSP